MRADPSHAGSLSAEAAYCPACDLKHVRQPDWLCPQCGMPVETEAWRSAVRSRADAPEVVLGFPLGSVIAGVVLAVTGVVLAIGFARTLVVEYRWPLVAATVVLLVLGLELLFKVSSARWVAIALAGLALLVVGEVMLRARWPDLVLDPLSPAARLALDGLVGALYPLRLGLASGLLAGTIVLVAGRPGRWRIVVGALAAASLAVAEAVRWFAP